MAKFKEQRRCRSCEGPFIARRAWQHFCSIRCRNHWHGKVTTAARRAYKAMIEQIPTIRG